MKILVINAGSSSLKYQLMDMDSETAIASGNCERIGLDGHFKHKTVDGRKVEMNIPLPDHETAFELVLKTLTDGSAAVLKSTKDIAAVGHRVVNGGENFPSSVLVTDSVIEEFEKVINFAPLHNPKALEIVKACRKKLGKDMQNSMVFDTSFHQTMPPHAYMFGIPFEYYEKYRLRRYGAHGTSHRYVSHRCAKLMQKNLSDLKIVTCHLGNGSSISAVNYGRCIDTSMGFTPLGGLMMGTRSGDLDPSVVTELMQKENLSPMEMEEILNEKSGFLGVSGVSSDARDLQEAAAKGSKRAQIVLNMIRYQIKKYIGSYIAALGGLDALVFTGGIGENSHPLRTAVCANMDYLGIRIDDGKNIATVFGNEGDIATPESKARVYVIPTNEELLIARDTQELLEQQG